MKKGLASTSAVLAFAAVAAVFVLSDVAFAHGGGKDEFSGHTVKATGEYHCHAKGAQVKLCDAYADILRMQAEMEAGGSTNTVLLTSLQAAERENASLKSPPGSIARGRSRPPRHIKERAAQMRQAESAATSLQRKVNKLTTALETARRGEISCVLERGRLAGRVNQTFASGWRTEARTLIRCLRRNEFDRL